jgi:nucleotide-binding universal stress UspA family protein/hemerythrin-like domain-containing protein
MYRHLLVTIDPSDGSADLVAHAVDLAAGCRAKVTFLRVVTQRDSAFHETSAPGTACHPDDRCDAAHDALARAEAAARAWGVPCASVQATAPHFATTVLHTARDRGCDLILIALPGESATGTAHLQATMDVLRQSPIPVLTAAGGSIASPISAITNLRGEHRTVAASLRAWGQELVAASKDERPATTDLAGSMLDYLKNNRMTHHEKERLLFTVLRERTAVVDLDLDELVRQHDRDSLLLSDLASKAHALAACREPAEHASARRRLERSLTEYAQFFRDHVGRLEAVVLPAARRHLQEADWMDLHTVYTAASGIALRPLGARCGKTSAPVGSPATTT